MFNEDCERNLLWHLALGNVFALQQIEARNSSTFHRNARGDIFGGNRWMLAVLGRVFGP